MVGLRTYDYKNNLPVLANEMGLRSPRSFQVDKSKVTSFAGAEGRIQRIVRPGAFAGSTGVAGTVRPLPRGKVADNAGVASTTTVISLATANHFIATEELSVLAPYAVLTLAGTWAASDDAVAVIDGVSITYTATGAVLADIATGLAAAINASPYLSRKVMAIADGAVVYVYAKDFESLYTTTASETTAGDGTLTAGAAAMVAGASIGTIASVDADALTVTLSAASAVSLPVGFPIGVAGSLPYDDNGSGYGMLSPNQTLDLEWSEMENMHGVFVGATVYKDKLPYIDDQLKKLFPEMQFI